jgi:uncharacterized protein
MHFSPHGRTATTLLVIAFGIISGPTRAADLPPINSPAVPEYHSGKFIWGDLLTDNPSIAVKFYTDLFAWTAQTVERTTSSGSKPYIVLCNKGRPIAGIALRPKKMTDEAHGRWVGYVSVPDVSQALAKAVASGGRVVSKVKNLPDRGTQAVFADAEGAILGLMHSTSGDPGEYLPDPGDWTWAELFAREPAAMGGLYQKVAGYEFMPDTRTPRPDDFILASGGFSRASIIPLPDRPKAHPVWLLFVRVANVRETVAKAVALGGRVAVAPSDTPDQYWRAVIVDPSGVHLGIVQLDETPVKQEFSQ